MKNRLIAFIVVFIICLSQPILADNVRNYDWYTSQNRSGAYSSENCGPTVAVMALKWLDKDFDSTVKDARATYKYNGGIWYTDDIKKYISGNGGKVSEIEFPSEEAMIKKMDDAILILCVDAGMLYKGKSNGKGHFVIIKGFIDNDDTVFLVHDPASKVRCKYPYEKLAKAAEARWYFALEVADNKE